MCFYCLLGLRFNGTLKHIKQAASDCADNQSNGLANQITGVAQATLGHSLDTPLNCDSQLIFDVV